MLCVQQPHRQRRETFFRAAGVQTLQFFARDSDDENSYLISLFSLLCALLCFVLKYKTKEVTSKWKKKNKKPALTAWQLYNLPGNNKETMHEQFKCFWLKKEREQKEQREQRQKQNSSLQPQEVVSAREPSAPGGERNTVSGCPHN